MYVPNAVSAASPNPFRDLFAHPCVDVVLMYSSQVAHPVQ